MGRRNENPLSCATQEISKITHRLPKIPHTKREAKALGEIRNCEKFSLLNHYKIFNFPSNKSF